MNLKKIGKVFTSKYVGTGPSSYEKRIYRSAVSQRLRNTDIKHACTPQLTTNKPVIIIKFTGYFFNPLSPVVTETMIKIKLMFEPTYICKLLLTHMQNIFLIMSTLYVDVYRHISRY